MTKPTQAQIREINRTLLATVRADWAFPHEASRQNAHHTSGQEPVTYRERFYSTSDGDEEDGDDDDTSAWTEEEEEELEEDEEEEEDLVTTESDETGVEATIERAAASPGKKKREKHSFYSPDSVAEYLERRVQARKRRKRRKLVEEMKWNPGLCFFLRRRNAWTGALPHEEVRRKESTKDTFLPTATTPDADESDEKELGSAHDTTKETQTSTADDDSSIMLPSSPAEKQNEPTSAAPFDPPDDASVLIDMLVPIATPFLPDHHPVRASIVARSHSELYEKVVRDSRTPAVPINLAHMMQVIVQGWKDEGNWPPRGTYAPEAPVAMRSSGNALRASRAVDAANDAHRGMFSNHKHIQKGVESVKRVLRLSGTAPPPGD